MWLVKAPGVGLLVEGHRDKEVEVKDGPVLVLQVRLVPAPGVAGGGRMVVRWLLPTIIYYKDTIGQLRFLP